MGLLLFVLFILLSFHINNPHRQVRVDNSKPWKNPLKIQMLKDVCLKCLFVLMYVV